MNKVIPEPNSYRLFKISDLVSHIPKEKPLIRKALIDELLFYPNINYQITFFVPSQGLRAVRYDLTQLL